MNTEQKLIRIIVEHYLEGGSGKLTIQLASLRAGITRQAFHRNYNHLKPFVLGKRPVEELLNESAEDVQGLLTKCQVRVRELQQELENRRAEQEEEIDAVRKSYITSLMNSDIALKNSDEIRETLEKQALHNDLLVKENQRLKLEVTAAKAKEIGLANKSERQTKSSAEILAIEPDFDRVFQKYLAHQDQEQFEEEKENAIDNLLKKVKKLCQTEVASVVLFIDRYMSNFGKYAQSFYSGRTGRIILVRTPIFNRVELKLFAGKICAETPVAIHIPFCASEPVVKAQRKFLFKDVPESEFAAADKALPPPIHDGYQEVLMFRIQQGD